MESEKPAFYQKALPAVEKIWEAYPELVKTFGSPSGFLKKVAEDSMLSTVGLTPANRASTTTIHELIRTLSNGEIPVAGQITGKELPITDDVTYAGLWRDMSNFSNSAGKYFYSGKRHEFIKADDRAELTAKFKVGSKDSGMGKGA